VVCVWTPGRDYPDETLEQHNARMGSAPKDAPSDQELADDLALQIADALQSSGLTVDAFRDALDRKFGK
jgi:hypothetical protein